MTAGPSPAGFSTAAPLPTQSPSEISKGFGYNLAVALDGNGDPAFAFIYDYSNGDTVSDDTRVDFRSWNRAPYKWNDLVHVGIVADVSSTFRNALAIAHDSSAGVFGITSQVNGGPDRLFISSDGGATWSTKANFTFGDSTLGGAAIAMANGSVYVAITTRDGLHYVSGKLSDNPATWQTRTAPAAAGVDDNRFDMTASIALDSNGAPGIAWWALDSNDGTSAILLFWRGAAGARSVKVMDTQSRGASVSVKLAYFRLNPRVLVWAQRNDGDSAWTGP